MSHITFKKLSGDQPELFPINIFDKIPQDHSVRLIDAVVDQLDISNLIKMYKGGGTSAYHPRMMLKVLFYAYLSNIYSCRKIAKALEENIYFMYLSGNSCPDFRTINNFRGQKLKGIIHELFGQIVKMLVELGYISLDVQYIDGTKIESTANRYTFVWRKNVERYKGNLEAKIDKILREIESSILSDNQEQNDQTIPHKWNTEELKQRLNQINEKLKEPTKQQASELKNIESKHLPKLEKYEKDLETLGDRNSFSKTDPDSTFMRMKEDHLGTGQVKPGYNAQISTEEQFITHASIHQTPGDTTTLKSHLEGFEDAYGKHSKEIVADAGYGSQENYEMLDDKGIEGYVKFNNFHYEQKKKVKQNPFLPDNLFYNQQEDYYVCPMGQRMERINDEIRISKNGYKSQIARYQSKRCESCPLRGMCHKASGNRVIRINHRLNELRNQARDRLNSEKGIYHRKKRSIEPEAVFGQLKSNNNFVRFSMRGLEKVELEFLLMALGHNFRKWTKIFQNKPANNFFLKDKAKINHNKPFPWVIYSNNHLKLSFPQQIAETLRIAS